jgi:uncharacterized membrane-anchored protein YitT (DUF2179 family)
MIVALQSSIEFSLFLSPNVSIAFFTFALLNLRLFIFSLIDFIDKHYLQLILTIVLLTLMIPIPRRCCFTNVVNTFANDSLTGYLIDVVALTLRKILCDDGSIAIVQVTSGLLCRQYGLISLLMLSNYCI